MSSPTVSHSLSPVSGRLSSNSSVTVSLSSGYHPQTNGQTERKIQEIGRYLRAYWNRFLPWAEYAQNSLKQTPSSAYSATPLFPWTEEPSVQLQQAVRRHKTYADVRQSSTPSIVLEIRSGSPPGICVSACPAGSWVPAISVPLPSRGRLMRSHSVSNSLHGIISIQYSMSHSSSLSLPLSQNLTSLQYLLLPRSSRNP